VIETTTYLPKIYFLSLPTRRYTNYDSYENARCLALVEPRTARWRFRDTHGRWRSNGFGDARY